MKKIVMERKYDKITFLDKCYDKFCDILRTFHVLHYVLQTLHGLYYFALCDGGKGGKEGRREGKGMVVSFFNI